MIKINLIKILLQFRYFLLMFVFLGIFYEIFFFSKTSDFLTFSMIAGWLVTVKLFHFGPRASFVCALWFLILTQLLSLFRVDLTPTTTQVEKAALWGYFFLVLAAIQQARELFNTKRQLKIKG